MDCGVEYCDEPNSAAIGGDFTIMAVDTDGDGIDDEYAVRGRAAVDLYRNEAGAVSNEPICSQGFTYSARLIMEPSQGCDANGQDCMELCPLDRPSNTVDPSGTCIGHFTDLIGDLNTYYTDCIFEDERSWFHPQTAHAQLFTNLWLSYPVETEVPTGVPTMPTWGDWLNAAQHSPPAGQSRGPPASRLRHPQQRPQLVRPGLQHGHHRDRPRGRW